MRTKRSGQQIRHVHRNGRLIGQIVAHQIPNLVVETQTESDVLRTHQPAHAHQHQVQEIDGSALDDPVDACRQESIGFAVRLRFQGPAEATLATVRKIVLNLWSSLV